MPAGFLSVVTMALAATLVAGCAASKTTVTRPSGAPTPVQIATKQELIERYNQQAAAVTSLNSSVKMTLTAGFAYTGVIKQYHEINGFLVVQKPASIRAIGQAPVVGTNIFDMQSDGETFHIFIPSQHKFITGPTNLERASAKPIENLRPQHLTAAIFWDAIPDKSLVLLEEEIETASQFYVLTVVRNAASGTDRAAGDWEIAQKIWFDRSDLNVARMETYEVGGKIGSDVRYSDWSDFGGVKFSREISLARPENDYTLHIGITKATLNAAIPAARFVLQQPPGTELVNVGKESEGTNPAETNAEGKKP
jgi:outer membrane lipoprotein-sorting protein